MERLTAKEKIKELSTLKKYNVLMTDNDYIELKLGQIEDIEDELGIDLITLFKASQGIDVYNESKTAIQIKVIPTLDLLNKKLICFTGDILKPYRVVYFKDYGKTWSLTKEELE